MKIFQYTLGQMQANCYFLVNGDECVLIDPADSADFLLEKIITQNLKLVGMIATHGHFDHIMAVGEIQLSYPLLPLYLHPNDDFLAKRVNQTAKYFLGFDPGVVQPHLYNPLKAGKLSISSFTFDVIETPGHSPGSCCIVSEDEKVIFSGDTIFKQAVGRYDFSYSDKKDLKKSVEKIMSYGDEYELFSGHGESTLIQDERMMNWNKVL
ncbi:MAG: MBL fold metallo-hydrolase [Candidatus Roizmanbacteria bacterium]